MNPSPAALRAEQRIVELWTNTSGCLPGTLAVIIEEEIAAERHAFEVQADGFRKLLKLSKKMLAVATDELAKHSLK